MKRQSRAIGKKPCILPPWVWVKRFRKRCGYGVHSPFAFDFITQVIYERGMYYAYKELDGLLPWYVNVLRMRPRKLLRLLFRVANYSEARHALFLGDDALAMAYMKAAIPKAEWGTEVAEPSADGQNNHADMDLIYVAKGVADASALPQAKIVIVDNLRQNTSLWQSFVNDPRTTLTFDLYDVGIVMQGLPLNRMDYIVNF